MPKATTNVSDTEKHDLKTCPGGIVVLRRMNYGEVLERRAMAGKMSFKGIHNEDPEAFLNMANRNVTEYEFRNCIVDHNLTDENDVPLDFRNSYTINMLDPRVGEEIASLIDAMNQAEKSLPNSLNGSAPALS